MLIEADARRFITEAIETDKDLAAIEQKEKARGRIVVGTPEYSEKRAKLVTILGKINSVANPEGMGRDDAHGSSSRMRSYSDHTLAQL